MSDDQYLIDRARQVIEGNMKLTLTIPQHEGEALLRRIRELEDRLATAEADALERAARVLTRAADEIRSLKPKADK